MINYIIMMCFPAIIGLYILYKNTKHNLKTALRYYVLLFYISNLVTVFTMFKILNKSFSQGAVFFLVYVLIASLIVIISSKFIIFNNHNFKFKLEKSIVKISKQKKIIASIILILSSLIAGGLAYYKKHFTHATLENLFFGLINNVEGTSAAVIQTISIYVLIFLIIYCIIAYIFMFPHKYNLILQIKSQKIKIIPIGFLSEKIIRGTTLLLIVTILLSFYVLNAHEFASSILKPGLLYEEHYIDPSKVKINFPEQQKNLIVIILESVENSLFSVASGGGYQKSIIPELEHLASENISFRPNENLISGLFVAPGCNWTAAAMVCQSSGVNLRYGLSINDSSATFLPGVHSLGKILEKEGYNLEIIMGSDGAFNNRDLYYKTHGNHKILDLYEAIDIGYLPQDYHNGWWGFEDSKLYEISKIELTRLAAEEKPFAYTMLTVDTHFPAGYLDEECAIPYSDQYLSSYACASSMINDFISWMQEQDFYKDTVVVITGDHLTMQDKMFNMMNYEDRYIYNTILNSTKTTDTTIRQGSSFDVFPTILSSMGVSIEGDRLGLGTDLYSKTPTLLEELGREKFTKETRAISNYYIENIVKTKKVK